VARLCNQAPGSQRTWPQRRAKSSCAVRHPLLPFQRPRQHHGQPGGQGRLPLCSQHTCMQKHVRAAHIHPQAASACCNAFHTHRPAAKACTLLLLPYHIQRQDSELNIVPCACAHAPASGTPSTSMTLFSRPWMISKFASLLQYTATKRRWLRAPVSCCGLMPMTSDTCRQRPKGRFVCVCVRICVCVCVRVCACANVPMQRWAVLCVYVSKCTHAAVGDMAHVRCINVSSEGTCTPESAKLSSRGAVALKA